MERNISVIADCMAIISFVISAISISASVIKKVKAFITSLFLECLMVAIIAIKRKDFSETEDK